MALITLWISSFASVRHFARGPTLTATLAAVLFGGSLFLELWFDTYQAALIAIGLVVPFFVLVDLALEVRSRAVLVLTALVLATMLSVYPLYIALLIGTAVVMVAARGVVLRRAGSPLRPLLRPLALSVVAVAALLSASALSGCLVAAAGGVAVGVAGAAVTTTAKVTGAVVGAGVHAVVPKKKKKKKDDAKNS